MVGASDLAFRLLCRRHGAELCYTEMLFADRLVSDAEYRESKLLSQLHEDDHPLIVQICGNDPAVLAAAARLAAPHCEAVDLNLGCPQRRAQERLEGAFLCAPQHWDRVYECVRAMADAVPVVSCKIRLLDAERAPEPESSTAASASSSGAASSAAALPLPANGQPELHVVIVLGRKLEPDGSASADLVNRVEEARRVLAELVEASAAPVRVVLSGGRLVFAQDSRADVASEASVMRELLLAGAGGGTSGAVASGILLDEQSTHTLENAIFARRRVLGCVSESEARPSSLAVHLVTSEVHMPRARACFDAVFADASDGCGPAFALQYHASPDGARVIPSEREGAIEAAMLRRLPHDVALYREHEVAEARRRFFTPNPEGADGEPHPHTWLHDPYSGESLQPGSGIPHWVHARPAETPHAAAGSADPPTAGSPPAAGRSAEEMTVAFARGLVEAGCSLLAVHGRTRGTPGKRRAGAANLDAVRAVVSALPGVPVLTNGNVRRPSDVASALERTGAAGAMVGEELLVLPALLRADGPDAPPPSARRSLALEYFALAAAHPPPSVDYARAHLNWMLGRDYSAGGGPKRLRYRWAAPGFDALAVREMLGACASTAEVAVLASVLLPEEERPNQRARSKRKR